MHSEMGRDSLEQILQTVSQGLIHQEAGGRVVFINQKAREVFFPGAEEDQPPVSGQQGWRLIYEDGSPCPEQEHPASISLRTGKALSKQVRGVLWGNRPVIWLSMDTKPLMGVEPGKPDSVIIVFTDITKRMVARELQRGNYRRQQIALDLAKLVQWEYEVDADLFSFDEKFYALYGTSSVEQGGNRMSAGEYAKRFLPPEDVPVVSNEIGMALQTTDPEFTRQLEHRIITGAGQIKHIIVRYGVVKDETGRTIKLFGANQDITELKAAEERLHEAQAVSHTGSWLLDLASGGLTLSDEASRLFGFFGGPPKSLADLRSRISPEHQPAVARAWARALQGGGYEAEYTVGGR